MILHDEAFYVMSEADILIETRDRRRYNDPTTKSEEMKVKNRTFSRNHAMSIHINLITIGATIWYGVRLGSRLTVAVA